MLFRSLITFQILGISFRFTTSTLPHSPWERKALIQGCMLTTKKELRIQLQFSKRKNHLKIIFYMKSIMHIKRKHVISSFEQVKRIFTP